MQYLTERECLRRLKAAGLPVRRSGWRRWVRDQGLRDVLVLGERLFVYEGELQSVISEAAVDPSSHGA